MLQGKDNDTNFRYNFKLRGKYIYAVRKASGDTDYDPGIGTDNRIRSVEVYNHAGKLVNSIQYTPYIYKAESYSAALHDDNAFIDLNINYDVKGKYVYIAGRKGIYRCQWDKTALYRVFDMSQTDIGHISNYICDFCYAGKDKYAFLVNTDYENEGYNDLYIVSKKM